MKLPGFLNLSSSAKAPSPQPPGASVQINVQPALQNNSNNTDILFKNILEELATAKARYDATLDTISDGLIITDNLGAIKKINATACFYLGLNSAIVTGKLVSDAYQVLDEQGNVIPKEKRPIFLALKDNNRISTNIVFITAQKQRKIFKTVATPFIEQGRKTGVIQTFQDITHEREVDLMKTEFISLASHQLRTPLSEIKWLSGILTSQIAGKLEPEQLKLSNNILRSTERMIDLVNSLLNISRIESGRIMIDPIVTDLHKLVADVVSDVHAKSVERKQNLKVEIAQDVPLISIDPRLIRQVYLNLLTNSIKYSPLNSEIGISVAQDGVNVVSAVTDQGSGIPAKEQFKVFNKFFRAENAVKIQADGSGLGLYLIKSIVEASGGRIWFKSVEGQGTTFWFSLPLKGTAQKKGEVTIDG